MARKIFMVISFVMFIVLSSYYDDVYSLECKCIMDEINQAEGEEKWRMLEQLLLKIKGFGTPPSDFFSILKGGVIECKDYAGGKPIKEKCGCWHIDKKNGYILISVTGCKNLEKYKSFKIYCTKNIDEKGYSLEIIFYKYRNYKEPNKEEGEPISSNLYFVIGSSMK
ncbi:MAG: hypothetical protein WBK20_04410 [Spirochaetota bacterium]